MLNTIYNYLFGNFQLKHYTSMPVVKILNESVKSTVHCVIDCEENKKYTIKYCIPQGIEYFNEVEILLLLKGVNGVQEYIYHSSDWGKMTIVYSYLEGDDLFNTIQKRELVKPEADLYFKQLLETIKIVHNYGISHRDLKAENVIVNNCNVTIIDWGLACFYTETKVHNCGSIYYIAPEVLSKNYDGVGYEMDIWALGVIWYCMHTKIYPFDFQNNKIPNDPLEGTEYEIEQCWSSIAKKIKEMNPDYSIVDPYVSKILKLIFVPQNSRIGIPKILKMLN